jgi:hypothetical protein
MDGRNLNLLRLKNRRGHWVLVLSLVLAIVLAVAVVSNGVIASERAAGAANPQDFADFLTAFAQRYQGKVHAVQLSTGRTLRV